MNRCPCAITIQNDGIVDSTHFLNLLKTEWNWSNWRHITIRTARVDSEVQTAERKKSVHTGYCWIALRKCDDDDGGGGGGNNDDYDGKYYSCCRRCCTL